MHAVVVGGAGFIGSHVVDRLLADGEIVDVVDDLSHGGLGNLADARVSGGELKIHHLDAGSPEAASLVGMRRPDVIFHLAAVPRGAVPTSAMARALATSMSLLEAARVHAVPKVVVVVPATAIYGRPASKDMPLKEAALQPRNVRGVIARATIDLLETYRELHEVEFTVLAAGTVYGPRQRPDGGLVAALIDAADQRRPPIVTGDGRQTRDLLFVDDAIDAIVRAGSRGSGLVINIGTGVQTSVSALWDLVAGPGAPKPVPAMARPDEIQRFAVSSVRARIHLGWSSWTPLAEGLASLRSSR